MFLGEKSYFWHVFTLKKGIFGMFLGQIRYVWHVFK
jgi:hypothetical protein